MAIGVPKPPIVFIKWIFLGGMSIVAMLNFWPTFSPFLEELPMDVLIYSSLLTFACVMLMSFLWGMRKIPRLTPGVYVCFDVEASGSDAMKHKVVALGFAVIEVRKGNHVSLLETHLLAFDNKESEFESKTW